MLSFLGGWAVAEYGNDVAPFAEVEKDCLAANLRIVLTMCNRKVSLVLNAHFDDAGGGFYLAVDLHFEHSAGRFQQLDVAVGKRLLQFRRQTGGAWLVVSDDAVFDGDFHARASRIETGTAGPFNRSPGQG